MLVMTITVELVIFILTILGLAFGVWWRIEARVRQGESDLNVKVSTASAQASLAARELADYKTHVAETFVTKQGLTEQMRPVHAAIADMDERIGRRLDTMTDRLDRVIEANHKPRRSSP